MCEFHSCILQNNIDDLVISDGKRLSQPTRKLVNVRMLGARHQRRKSPRRNRFGNKFENKKYAAKKIGDDRER